MKCILLAAGYATRLYPLTLDRPKPLLPVGGKPILDWLVEDVAGFVSEFVVVSNHRFAAAFEDWAKARPEAIRIKDDGTETNETRLGAVRDIQLAAEGMEEPVLVMAGDNVLDFSLAGFIRFAREKGTSAVMAHRETRLEALQKTAVITVDDAGRITSYEEKPKEPRGTLAVPPFYYYLPEDLARIEEALAEGCGADAPGSYAAWLSGKVPMHAYVMPGHRWDIGDRKSYDLVRDSYTGPAE